MIICQKNPKKHVKSTNKQRTLAHNEVCADHWVFFLVPHADTSILTCNRSCSPGGIGHALALELKQRGLKVFATARTLTKISDLKDAGIHYVHLSVDDPISVAACHEEVVKALDGKGLDYLFNNAGLCMCYDYFGFTF